MKNDSAPQNCLQYKTGVQGSFKSFNFEDVHIPSTGYLSNLDYTICFRKEPGFCTVTYSVASVYTSDQNTGSQSPEQDQAQAVSPGRYFNIIPDTSSTNSVGAGQAGAGPYECPSDYIMLAGIRFCGSRLNPQLYPATPNPTFNADVTGQSLLMKLNQLNLLN